MRVIPSVACRSKRHNSLEVCPPASYGTPQNGLGEKLDLRVYVAIQIASSTTEIMHFKGMRMFTLSSFMRFSYSHT